MPLQLPCCLGAEKGKKTKHKTCWGRKVVNRKQINQKIISAQRLAYLSKWFMTQCFYLIWHYRDKLLSANCMLISCSCLNLFLPRFVLIGAYWNRRGIAHLLPGLVYAVAKMPCCEKVNQSLWLVSFDLTKDEEGYSTRLPVVWCGSILLISFPLPLKPLPTCSWKRLLRLPPGRLSLLGAHKRRGTLSVPPQTSGPFDSGPPSSLPFTPRLSPEQGEQTRGCMGRVRWSSSFTLRAGSGLRSSTTTALRHQHQFL